MAAATAAAAVPRPRHEGGWWSAQAAHSSCRNGNSRRTSCVRTAAGRARPVWAAAAAVAAAAVAAEPTEEADGDLHAGEGEAGPGGGWEEEAGGAAVRTGCGPNGRTG